MLKLVSINRLIFDVKNEKFEHLEDLYHTMLKKQPKMIEALKVNHFYAHLRMHVLQTFRNIIASNNKIVDNVLIVFRRKVVKQESKATAKNKWHKLTFDPNTKVLSDFLETPNKNAEKVFWLQLTTHHRQLTLRKSAIHLKQSLNLAYLENGLYDQIVAHLEKDLELSGMENHEELSMPTVTAVAPNDNVKKLNKLMPLL